MTKMKKHTKNYIDYFGFYEGEYIPCENCSAPAVDLHHIVYRSQKQDDSVGNIIALCRDCHDAAHFKKEPYLKEEQLQETHKFYLDVYAQVQD